MNYTIEKRTLRDNETAFLRGLAGLAKMHKLTPREVLPMLGHMARLAATSEHALHGRDLDEAMIEALELVLSGAGAVADNIVLVAAPTNPNPETH